MVVQSDDMFSVVTSIATAFIVVVVAAAVDGFFLRNVAMWLADMHLLAEFYTQCSNGDPFEMVIEAYSQHKLPNDIVYT